MDYVFISASGTLVCVILLIVIEFNIKYKGNCIFHDWEYKCEWGDYWKFTGSFLETNRRYVCRKCKKVEKA
jgi:hypothetical protein